MRLAIAALIFFFWQMAGTAPLSAQTNPTAGDRPQAVDLASLRQQNATLEAEIALIRSYQDRQLTVIVWSLGTVTGLGLLLVGYGWFTNFKLYERDKASLVAELNAQQANNFKRLELEVRESLVSIQTELRGAIEEKQSALESNLAREIEDFSKESKTTGDRIKKQISALESEMNRRFNDVTYELMLAQREKWLGKDVRVNALGAAEELLRLARSGGNYWRIGESLDFIENDVDAILKNDDLPPDAQTIASLMGALEKLDSTHSIVVGRIKSKLSKMRNTSL